MMPRVRYGLSVSDFSIAGSVGCTVSVSCGVHLDGIRPKEIRDVLEMAEGLTRELRDRLEETGGN